MNRKMILNTIGYILLLEAGLMAFGLVTSMIYHEAHVRNCFLISIAITAGCGGLLLIPRAKNKKFYAKEGFVIVALAWISLSLCGALPFFISGGIPNYIDAVFETVSGFTTTGASILTDVESLGYGLLFWRSFTHWIGGMGVLVFMLIIVPIHGGQGIFLLRAESPGPTSGKLVPKMHVSARILYEIYMVMTVLLVILLKIGGLPLYDSLVTAFGTAGTGGFSNWGASIAHYNSAYVDIVVSIFMLAFGVNFNLYYLLLLRKGKSIFKNEELRWYLGIVGFAIVTIAINVVGQFESFAQSLRFSLFQVASIVTTTGFATADFNLWPEYSKTVLVTLMFMGACAGSTGGGLKVSRILLLIKNAKRELRTQLRPRSVHMVHMDGKAVEEQTLRNCGVYLSIYCLIGIISLLIISLDNFSFTTNFTAVVATFNNIGPGLDVVGPTGNFAGYSWLSKIVLSFDMLAGRLEIYPVLLLFAPSLYKMKTARKK